MPAKSGGRKLKAVNCALNTGINNEHLVMKAAKNVCNTFLSPKVNIKIVGDKLKINNIEVDQEKLDYIEINEKYKCKSMFYLIPELIDLIITIRGMANYISEIGGDKYLDNMVCSKKGIENELMSIYECTQDELLAHMLEDLYKIRKSTEMMKFLSTVTYLNSDSVLDSVLAHVLVLSLYPAHFYKVVYYAEYTVVMCSYAYLDNKKSDDTKKTVVFKEIYDTEYVRSICSLLGLKWIKDIVADIDANSLKPFESIYDRYSNELKGLDEEDSSDLFDYIKGKITVDKYITKYTATIDQLSQFRRAKLIDYSNCYDAGFHEFYKSLSPKEHIYLSNILDTYYCPNVITVENAIRTLVKSHGDKYFKTKYLKLFEDNRKLSAQIKEHEDKSVQSIKEINKEKKKLIIDNKKLTETLNSKEREIDKLKDKCAQKDNELVSSDELNKVVNENKDLENKVRELNEELNSRISKCNDILSENEKLKETLNLYGISLNDSVGRKQFNSLSLDDEDAEENSNVSLEEKINYLNKFKIAICGSKRELINRVGERGIKDLYHIDQIGSCKKNGKYDLYLICTDFISHPLRWQIETKVREQDSIMVYFTGTNIDRMISVMYNTLIK